MKFYTRQHKYYCGIDLHTKNMYICILLGAESQPMIARATHGTMLKT